MVSDLGRRPAVTQGDAHRYGLGAGGWGDPQLGDVQAVGPRWRQDLTQTEAHSYAGVHTSQQASHPGRQDGRIDSRTEYDPLKNTGDTPWVSKYQPHRRKQYLTPHLN